MTDKEKLEKLKKLADAMYYAAQYLTTDASRLHKARDEYHQFIIYEYHKEESVIKDIEEAAVNAFKQIVDSDKNNFLEVFKAGAEWQKEKEKQNIKLANKALIKRGVEWLKKGLDNGMWIDQFLSIKEKEAIIEHFKEWMEE